MGSTKTVPDAVATHAAAVFYVIFGLHAQLYLGSDGPYDFDYFSVEHARRFQSTRELLSFVSSNAPLGPIEIRRVEEITVKSTEQRRILDHGEQAPTGATIQWTIINGYTADNKLIHEVRCAKEVEGRSFPRWDVPVAEALLFPNELEAMRYSMREKIRNGSAALVRRVAITRTTAKPEYKVTTLA